MSVKISTQKKQNKKPEQILIEQLSLALSNYYQAIRNEQAEKGLTIGKARKEQDNG
jgi:hypothetical protein